MLGKGKKHHGYQPKSVGLFLVPRVTPTTGLFAAENGDDLFTAFLKHFGEFSGSPPSEAALQHPDTAVNELVKNYGAVVVIVDRSGSKLCYSSSYRNQLPTDFTDRLRQIGVMPADSVYWSSDVFTQGQPYPAREVLWGELPNKPPKAPSRREVAKRWQHPEELTPDELRFLMGKEQEPPQ